MALYLTARHLEEAQGWLYNYFIFTDDDAVFHSGNLMQFQVNLREWQPAIGVPGFISSGYPQKDIDSSNHVDYIFIAFHREVMEVSRCIYSIYIIIFHLLYHR